MKRFSIIATAAISLMLTSPHPTDAAPFSKVAQPPAGYQTDEVLRTVTNDWGSIPLRRGFWDADIINRYRAPEKGEGFGTDKAEHKHGITNLDLISYVMLEDEGSITQSEDGTYGSSILFDQQLTTQACLYSQAVPICSDVSDPLTVKVVAELDYLDYYYSWPASLNDDGIVGLVTAYCDGYDGFCPEEVNYSEQSGVFTPTA